MLETCARVTLFFVKWVQKEDTSFVIKYLIQKHIFEIGLQTVQYALYYIEMYFHGSNTTQCTILQIAAFFIPEVKLTSEYMTEM